MSDLIIDIAATQSNPIPRELQRADLHLVHGIYHRGADGDYTWSGEWNET